jgi:DNA-binding transcriptional MerR regulator
MPENLPTTNRLLSISQAAQKLNVSIKTLRRWENSGLVHPIRNELNRRMYSEAELDNLENRKYKPLPQNSIAPQNYHSISEAADEIGVSVKTLRRWDSEGKINTSRDELNRRVFTADLISQIKTNRPSYGQTLPATPVDTIPTQPETVNKKHGVIHRFIPIALTPLLSLLPFILITLPIILFSILGYKPSLPVSTVDFSATPQSGQELSFQPLDPSATGSAYPQNVNPLLSRIPRGEVAGLTVTGGSLLSFETIIDDNFNFGVAGLVEGSQLVSTTTVKPPMIVASQEKVTNLNADLLDGRSWEDIETLVTAVDPNAPVAAVTLQDAFNNGNSIVTGSGSNLEISGAGGVNISVLTTLADDLAVNGGDLTSTATTFNLLTTTSSLNIGATTGTTSIKNTLNIAGDLTSSNTIAIKPSGDSDDYIYLTTSADQPGIFFAGATSGSDPGIRVNSSSGRIEFRDQGSSTWNALGTSTSTSVFTDGGTYAYPTNRESIRVYDSTGADYIDIAHDGTNVLFTTNGTTEVRLDNDLVVTGNITPSTNAAYDLGTSTNRFRDIYVSGSSIHLGSAGNEALISYNTANDYLGLNPSADGTPELMIYDDGTLVINGTTLTASATELNLLSGITSFAGWDQDSTNDLVLTDLGVTVQGYNLNTSFLGQTIEESEMNITNGPLNGYILQTDAVGTLTWADPNILTAGANYWIQTGQQLYPKNALWNDLLIGGTSTMSATIALQANTGALKAASGLFQVNSTGQISAHTINTINGIGINSGTIFNASWNGNIIGTQYGGTGLDASAASNGQLLIGNGSGFSLSSLTGTANQITITPGAGSITVSLPQNIHTAATPTFNGLTLSGLNPATDSRLVTVNEATGLLSYIDTATWDYNLWDDVTFDTLATAAASILSNWDQDASDDYVSPVTTAGDLLYGGIGGAATRLAGASVDNHILKYDLDTNTPYWDVEAGTTYTGSYGITLVGNDFQLDDSFFATWDMNSSDDVTTASIGATVQAYNADTSFLGQTIEESEINISNAPEAGYILQTGADGTLTWISPGSVGVDTNNYTTSIAFSGTTTKTLTLSRDGLIDLTADFTDLDTTYTAGAGLNLVDTQFSLDMSTFTGWDQNIWDDITVDNLATAAAAAGFITDGNTNWDNSYGFITADSTDLLTNKSGNISMWTNDAGYLTNADIGSFVSFADTLTWDLNVFDDLDTASVSAIITSAIGTTLQGYNVDTSFLGQSIDTSELDAASFATWDQNIWDDITVDNLATAAAAAGFITDGNTNWDNSYGFITADSTDLLTNKSGNISMWTNDAGYLTNADIGSFVSFADTLTWDLNVFDDLDTASVSAIITSAIGTTLQGYNVDTSFLGQSIDTSELDAASFATWDQNIWDDITVDNLATAAAAAGFITDGNTNWDNSYGFITADSTDLLTNKSGNISMWTNDAGYLTNADIGSFVTLRRYPNLGPECL